MRLGQLARKLAISPSALITLLEEENILVGEGANSRLTEDQVALIHDRFRINQPTEPDSVPSEVESEPVSVTRPIEDDPSPEDTPPREVIKAERIELSGLKVLGRIELPEPKKVETTPAEMDSPGESSPSLPTGDKDKNEYRERRGNKRGEKKRSQSRKNPVALRRQREEEALREQKLAEAAAEKERRTRRYFSTVKQSPPTRAARIVSEPVEQLEPEMIKEKPKTWLGRVLHWLTHAD